MCSYIAAPQKCARQKNLFETVLQNSLGIRKVPLSSDVFVSPTTLIEAVQTISSSFMEKYTTSSIFGLRENFFILRLFLLFNFLYFGKSVVECCYPIKFNLS